MKRIFNLSTLCITTLLFLFTSCSSLNNNPAITDTTGSVRQINAMLDSFNVAAGKADYNRYFNFYTDDGIFTGTDATERWDKKTFMVWAKPIFDKGHAWNFTSLKRNVYIDKTGQFAWFDELLNTQMKICRGSGVVVKQGNEWKVQQYILSVTVPNDLLDGVIKIKTPIEDSIINKLSSAANNSSQPAAKLNIDALKASPGIFKVLMENEHVRVIQYSLKPGEKDNWHTHPPKSSYVVSGGKLKVYLKNGETILADEKAGTASWMDYVGEHYVENIGNTTVTIVLTEIK
jgi:quercetin dioxygenase-like cupin family protein/ketosteroid isomerase-like protein